MTLVMVKKTGKKAVGLYQQNNNSACASPFLYVSQPSLQGCDVKVPNFMHPLYEVGEHNTKFFFSFSKLL